MKLLFLDYDAPIAEDGSLTEKWYRTRQIIREFFPDQGLYRNEELLT